MENIGATKEERAWRQKRFTVNLYIASCAALRELQYSVEDLLELPDGSFTGLVGALEASGADGIGTLAKAGVEFCDTEEKRDPLHVLIRAIIAFRLLLAVLPSTATRSAGS